jgi:enamine deaminase RidA (YjgF/YER057c/UK114 family)
MNETEIAAGLSQTSNYRYAERVGGRLFVAGQVPRDGSGNLVGEGDAAAQARQCLANLFTLIVLHGFSRNDIRQLTIYVVGEHSNLIDAWREVAAAFETEVPPATLLGVNLLGYVGQLVEIDAQIAAD